MNDRPCCFFVMPFAEELNYFYLYLKKHIEGTFALDVERGDTERLTRPVVDKVTEQIRRSRLVIADITGDNPNVMYEVGLAHALGKPVLFLTQSDPETTPFDLRHYDLITYKLADADGLIRQLDQALQSELAEQFADLYEQACAMLEEVNQAGGSRFASVSRDAFLQRIRPVISTRRLPRRDEPLALAEALLPRIVQDSTDMKVIRAITAWLDERFA